MADAYCPLEVNALLADQDIKVGIVMHPGERIIWDWLRFVLRLGHNRMLLSARTG